MPKFATALFCVLFSIESFAQDKIEASKLSSSEIKDFINTERKLLRGKHKVELPEKFINESSVFARRYGNTKNVLNLNGISLSGMDLRGTAFTMASMIKSDLSNADLTNSDLVYVDLTGSNLMYANLTNADLSNAVFEATKLKGANFDGANLFGARFIKISDLSNDELKKLKKRTNSYVNLDREELPDYYRFED